jgi:trehalose 6-phosphate synthase/phosphatase
MNNYRKNNSFNKNRLVIVSNRLPVVLIKTKNNSYEVQTGSGGLVTALAPVLSNRGGLWIGWPGNVDQDFTVFNKLLAEKSKDIGYDLKPIYLTQEERDMYYKGFANEILWPLFHDLIGYCNFDPEYWNAYQTVSEKFAMVTADNVKENDFIWVHDYHLIAVISKLRSLGISNKIGFFLHIPFPPADIFARLPWRFEILNFLLQYDIIGFQSLRDRRNFFQCIRHFIPDLRGSGRGRAINLRIKKKKMRIGIFPISIDYYSFRNLAMSQGVEKKMASIRRDFLDQKIILGVDRMDYTKGILDRLKAFRNALKRYPELIEKINLIQIVVPSRRQIEQYEALKIEIERLVGQINGEFSRMNWIPVHYFFRSLDKEELVAYYRSADIALITPIKDGANLVAKEYCAANVDETGVLILSEFAGTAGQFEKGAILVNPHDIQGMADAIHYAYYLPEEDRKRRMRYLRNKVRQYDIFWWVNSFLEAAILKKLNHFPLIDEYNPFSR